MKLMYKRLTSTSSKSHYGSTTKYCSFCCLGRRRSGRNDAMERLLKERNGEIKGGGKCWLLAKKYIFKTQIH
jgi:hypothetical protein